MRSIGIDIGRYSIKVVEAMAHHHNYELIRAREYKVLNAESDRHEIAILQSLKQISKEFNTDSAKVTTSIRQQYISTRKLLFPFKERLKIQKSLAFELEDHLPIPIHKTVYDSKIIRLHEKSAEVIAMACVKEEVEKTLKFSIVVILILTLSPLSFPPSPISMKNGTRLQERLKKKLPNPTN